LRLSPIIARARYHNVLKFDGRLTRNAWGYGPKAGSYRNTSILASCQRNST
jgi:hypothetical protein